MDHIDLTKETASEREHDLCRSHCQLGGVGRVSHASEFGAPASGKQAPSGWPSPQWLGGTMETPWQRVKPGVPLPFPYWTPIPYMEAPLSQVSMGDSEEEAAVAHGMSSCQAQCQVLLSSRCQGD